MSLGSVSRAVAADTFETWPKKTTEPGVEPKPEPGANGAATAGRAAGEKTDDRPLLRNDRGDRPRRRPDHRDRGRGGRWRRLELFTGLQSITEPSAQDGSLRSRSSLEVATLILAVLLPFLAASPARAASPEDHPAVPAILARAESLFQSMKARDYPAIFAALSAKSRETIVAETTSALAAAARQAPPGMPTADDAPPPSAKNPAPGPDAVRSDFVAGGPIARDYWDAFLRRFDPDAALEHSRWEIGSVGKDRAEILLTHHGATHPATLKMFREDGGWKVGLVETFWTR